ncbi:MAG: AsmA family protein [Rhodospirillaceae bacterium]
MKKIMIVLGFVVTGLVLAVMLAPALVPAARIKAELVARVKAATGRDLIIDGKMSVSVLPALGVQVAGVALTNPPGARLREMMRVGSLDVRLKLWPLVSGQVEIESFVLREPVINLEVDRSGRGNWVFGETAAAAPAPAPAPAPTPTPTPARPAGAKPETMPGAGDQAAKPLLADVRLGDVRIVGGKLAYLDDKGGSAETAEAINLTLDLKSLDEPLVARGGLTWHGQAVTLDLTVAKPRALIEGRGSAAGISVSAAPVTLAFTGELAGAGGTAGALELTASSARALAGWAGGKPLAFAGSGLGPLSLKARLAAGGGKIALTQAVIGLDAVKAVGELSVVTGGARPALRGRLDLETLDLAPYLAPEGRGAAADSRPAGGGKAGDSRPGWSEETIDASALKAFDAEVSLTVAAIRLRRFEVGRSVLALSVRDGRLTADLSELALYQGKAKGKVTLDGSQPAPGLTAVLSLKGLRAESFLAAFGFERLEGAGNAELQVNGRGANQRQIVASLAGKGSVSFLNGAIRGINLAAMARNLTSAFTDTGGTQKTDFAELSGTFSISKGVVSNPDLALKSPLLRVGGAGSVDLARRTANYRVEPKLVASLEGQGGAKDLGGITVPVIVEGPWDGLSFRPDLEALAKGAAGKAVNDLLKGKALPKGLPVPVDPGKLFGR